MLAVDTSIFFSKKDIKLLILLFETVAKFPNWSILANGLNLTNFR